MTDTPRAVPQISPEEALVVNVRGGARVCVPPFLNQITSFVLLEQEDWFEDEIRFVRAWLQPGMRAVDVGANYGLYTLAAALRVGAGGRVWAIVVGMPQRSPEMERRGQLLRIAAGRQAGPLAVELLRGRSEENLNPEFWCSPSR